MNVKYAILSFAILLSGLFSSCKKSDSVINGKVTYIGAVSGITYDADGADVQLHMGAVGQTGGPSEITTTDANGNYNFRFLGDGNWTISASITVNGIYYYGESAVVMTNGSNSAVANIVMN
jgi:hypothetical protein